jgi:hypothetical protein
MCIKACVFEIDQCYSFWVLVGKNRTFTICFEHILFFSFVEVSFRAAMKRSGLVGKLTAYHSGKKDGRMEQKKVKKEIKQSMI